MKTNKILEKQLKKVMSELDGDQVEFVEAKLMTENIYESILDLMEISQDDKFLRDVMYNVLRERVSSTIIFSIWENLTDDQALHLRQFIDQASVIYPGNSNDNILMEFAVMYPALKKKIFVDLSNFLKKFVADFKNRK